MRFYIFLSEHLPEVVLGLSSKRIGLGDVFVSVVGESVDPDLTADCAAPVPTLVP